MLSSQRLWPRSCSACVGFMRFLPVVCTDRGSRSCASHRRNHLAQGSSNAPGDFADSSAPRAGHGGAVTTVALEMRLRALCRRHSIVAEAAAVVVLYAAYEAARGV